MTAVPTANPQPSLIIPRRPPLAEEVALVLRERLRAGFWTGFLPGEHQLCAELRVSRMTLRAALQQLAAEGWLERGGHGRRHRVLKPGSSRGGRQAARTAKAREVRMLSLLPAERIVGVMQTAMAHLGAALEAKGYTWHLVHLTLPTGRRGVEELARITAMPTVAGWILYCASEEMQRWFAERRLTCIVLGGCFSGVPLLNVEFDARAIGRHAGNEFLRRGHARLAIVRPSLLLAGDMECAAGLREAASRPERPAEVLDLVYEPTVEGIRQTMERALGRPHPPTAFLVAQPNFVWPVMGCLYLAGRRIPRDAAVISRADDLFLKTAIPTVACYHHDGARLGNTAARLLLSLLSPSSHPPASKRLIPEFIGGESLG